MTAPGIVPVTQDALGSVTGLSNAAGQMSGGTSYAAFGGVEAQTGVGSRYGFTGRELDQTGLMYYRARYMDPGVGRFSSQDTFRGLAMWPPSLHLFAYGYNTPAVQVDPSGHGETKDTLEALVTIVLGLASGILTLLFDSGYVPELLLQRGFSAAAAAIAGFFGALAFGLTAVLLSWYAGSVTGVVLGVIAVIFSVIGFLMPEAVVILAVTIHNPATFFMLMGYLLAVISMWMAIGQLIAAQRSAQDNIAALEETGTLDVKL